MKRAFSRKNCWDALPVPLKAIAGGLLRRLPRRWVFGPGFARGLTLARAADRWSADQAAAYQLAQVRRVLKLAYEQTRYYRRVFDARGFAPGDLRELADLARLPTIDRDTLRDHLDEMCTRPVDARDVDYVSTGGTSGTPLAFYIQADRSGFEFAHLVTGWARVGYRLGDKLAVFRGRIVPPNRGGLRHQYDPLLAQHYYSNFHLTDEQMGRYLAHLRGIGPCFLHVYPSAVATLAAFIRRSGCVPPDNIRAIIAESEIVYPQQRRTVADVLGCRYFSCYGHSEKVIAAAECEHGHDDHVWPSYGYTELLDDSGRPVSQPGQRGELVGTGFINEVVPFIRYRTGDIATLVGTGCRACGRNHLVIREIRGHRTQEHLVANDGASISWTALNLHDETFARVQRFQFHQRRPGAATLRIVPAAGFGEADRAQIRRSLDRRLEGRLDVQIELCAEIALTPRGKATYVIQEIPECAGREPETVGAQCG